MILIKCRMAKINLSNSVCLRLHREKFEITLYLLVSYITFIKSRCHILIASSN